MNWNGGAAGGKDKGGKGGKDGGKAKGGKSKGSMQCSNCNGWGDRASNCPSDRRINSIEDIAKDTHENEDEDDTAWLMIEENTEDEFQEVKSKRKKKNAVKLDEPEELMVVEETQGNWVRVSAGVDSCASNTVLPVEMFPEIEKKETEQSRSGKCFTAANNTKIRNEGENIIPFVTENGESRRVRAQLAKVTRMLISASKMTRAGYKVNLDEGNPHVKNIKTGRVTKLRHKNGIFLFDLWVNTEVTGPVFKRQGS